MEFIQIFFLAFLQGLTEFLPISSSGHLIILPSIFGWEDQGLAFDIAVHWGSLIAVFLYFKEDLFFIFSGLLKRHDESQRLFINIIIASIPLGLAGLLFGNYIENNFRLPLLIAFTTAFFGIFLWASDILGKKNITGLNLSSSIALLIGVGQALALVPGTSRSGITIAFALLLGLDRIHALKFSFLLSIPAICMAVIWQSFSFFKQGVIIPWGSFLIGLTVSAFTAYFVIHFFLKFFERIGLVFFAIYRLFLAGIIFIFFI